jgi:hypothetical protein
MKDELKQKWGYINYDRQIMIITAAWKAAGSVMEGTNIPFDKLAEFAEHLTEKFFLFEYLQKPPVKSTILKTNNIKTQPPTKEVPF